MTKNEFKIGDRVRDKENPCRFGVITSINHYDDPDCMVVRFDDEDERVCYVTDLEIYPNRKTAFLTELQELLNRHNAFFIAHKTNMPVSVYFNDNEDDAPFASIGKEINEGCGVIVDADNIMDFDKE